MFAESSHPSAQMEAPAHHLAPALLWTMTVAAGVAVANLYYNQPMLADMMRSFGVTPHSIGLVATFTQVGYAIGLFVFLPLGDFLERRPLIVSLFLAVAIALVGAALAKSLAFLIIASFFVGLTTVNPQILIPLAADLAAPEEHGRTIGTVMSGLLLGILLARTLSGFVSQHFGWRTMYGLAAVLSVAFAALLFVQLPRVPARPGITYPELLHSLWRIAVELPKLRQISLVAATLFAAFSAFWTTLVFLLETPPYHYGSQAAGLFGLVGAVGAFIAPVAGRVADLKSPRFVVGHAIVVAVISYVFFWLFGLHIWGLVIGVILLDMGVQAAQVANQSRVLSLRPDARSRINTVYMICYFFGASLGSLLGSWSWSRWHWHGVCATGVALLLIGSIAFVARGADPQPAHSPA